MKKILFFAIALLFPFFCWAEKILYNQVGYYPHEDKKAAITYETNDSTTTTHFRLLTTNNEVKYEGKVGSLIQSIYSSLRVRNFDFSDFTTPGIYKIQVGIASEGVFSVQQESAPFTIGDRVLSELGKSLMKSYYFQRASINLSPRYAGAWARIGGHPDDSVYIHSSAATAERPTGSIISTPGGWYDAGDYNKYITTAAPSVAVLLSAYESFPSYWADIELNIPESGNGLPDLLNETLYSIRWMLTMQDIDGGVYHKTTTETWEGDLPVAATMKRWVVKKNTAATLDFAAVMAQAYRIYKGFPQTSGLANACLNASKRAWEWAQANPKTFYSDREQRQEFDPPIITGAESDGVEGCDEDGNCTYNWNRISDEWFWAATELYLSTGIKEYEDYVYANVRSFSAYIPMYCHTHMYAFFSLLRIKGEMFWPLINQTMLAYAASLKDDINLNAYRVVMGRDHGGFSWGGNATAMNQSMHLLYVYRMTNDRRYLDAALTNIDYVLGKNPNGYCFVTGFGSKSPMQPHHQISTAGSANIPIPGLLVGGPVKNIRAIFPDYSFSDFPPDGEDEVMYIDKNIAATNEPCIRYNAPAVFVVGAMESYMRRYIPE